jgi:hypothetical protein
LNVCIVANGLLSQGFVLGGIVGGSGAPTVQLFEQALVAELNSISALTSILGTIRGGTTPGIFKTGYPQTYDLETSGPALTYSVPTKPKGQVLAGSNATATARVQLDIWAYSESAVKQAMAAIYSAINGPPGTWGNGTCIIMAVVHQGDTDSDEPPKAGSDQWLYHSFSEYMVQYRLTAGGG